MLLDEAYFPYSKLTLIDKINSYENLVVIRSLKTSIIGLRVGYLVANKNLVRKIGSFRPLYEINSLGAFYFSELLRDYSKIKNLIKNCFPQKNISSRIKKKRY